MPKICACCAKSGRIENGNSAKMTELLTSAQMRAVERAAIESGAVTGLALMERAGAGVVAAILAQWPALLEGGRRAVVFCGPGNNGGDGFVVARLLKDRGWEVELFLYGDAERLPPDARVNHDRWALMGAVRAWLPDEIVACAADLFVDASFGAGLARALPEAVIAPLTALHVAGRTFDRLVAIDAPSGLCLDSGRPLGGAAVCATLTVSFHRPRPGHYLAEGPLHCGQLRLVDLGLDPVASPEAVARQAEPACQALRKGGRDHKFAHGHALVLSGPAGRGGAARLAARGALRVGAGLVTVGAPAEAMAEHAARLDAVMLREVGTAGALAAMLEDGRITALCLGPGLGLGSRQAGLVAQALRAGLPCVLDADALTLIAREPALFAALHPRCVLTPHAGEFGRLFPDLAARLAAPVTRGPAYSKVDATGEAAARAGCIVLFKGADTVIADPAGRCRLHAAAYERAAPWLATAGSGDVLAGILAGLLARGVPGLDAACTSAWLHVEAARAFGPGLIAEDLPEALPGVFRGLGL